MVSWSRYAGGTWVAALWLAACGSRTAPGEWALEAQGGSVALGQGGVLGAGRSGGGSAPNAGSPFVGSGGASLGGGGASPVEESGGESGEAGSAGEGGLGGAGGAPPLLATFEALGPDTAATAISADGRVVVGSVGVEKVQGFRYTDQTGLVGLGFFSKFEYADSTATATNRDGSVVVGSATDDVPGGAGNFPQAYRVQVPGPLERFAVWPDWSPSYASGVSADGQVIVGVAAVYVGIENAFRWSESAGVEQLGDFVPNAVSADGKVIVGSRAGDFGRYSVAVRWTKRGPLDLAVPGPYAVAIATNADGTVVVGQRFDTYGAQVSSSIAFRWTKRRGALDLSALPGSPSCLARAVNGDGSVVVGECDGEGAQRDRRGVIWDAAGVRSLADVLQAAGADLQGLTLTSTTGVSADGKAFCGVAVDPNGKTEAWLARLP